MKIFTLQRRCLFTFLLISFFPFYQAQQLSVSEIAPVLIKNSNAVIRLEKSMTEIYAIDKMKETYELTVTLLNEKASEFNHLVAYYSDDEKIQVSAILYDSFGNEIKKIKQKEFLDESINQGYNISDVRVLHKEIHRTQFPYTVYFRIEKTSPNTAFISSFSPYYTENCAIEKSEYFLKNSSSIPLYHKVFNEFQQPLEEIIEDTQMHFAIENYTAFVIEPFSPSLSTLKPNVKFSLENFNLKGSHGNATSWNSFGKWMYDQLIASTLDLDNEKKSYLQELVKNAPSIEEKIKLIYNDLQNNMRYVSVQLGIGGWKPMLASKVDKYKYGDCKALSNYMVNSLNAIDIPANYTVLYSSDEFKNFDEDFVKMQGNHVIVNIPLEKDTVWLECTSNDLAYNYISPKNDNRRVLSINKEGGTLVKTPKYNSSENLSQLKMEINVHLDSKISINVERTSSGALYQSNLHLRYKKKNAQKEFYKKEFNEIPDVIINTISFKNNKKDALFEEKIKGESPHFLKKIGSNYLFHAIPYGKIESKISTDADRLTPLELRRGLKSEKAFYFNFPYQIAIDNLPKDITINNSKFGSYTLKCKVENNQIIVYRTLHIHDGTYKPEEYNEFVSFYNSIVESDQSKILIKKL